MIKRCFEFLFIAAILALLFMVLSSQMGELGANTPVCPQCESADSTVPIIYGLVAPPANEEAAQGKCILGGCVVSPDSPKWHCKKCGQEWGTADVARETSPWWHFR